MDGGRVPGWSGEGEESPDAAMRLRVVQMGLWLTSMMLGFVPVLVLGDIHPLLVWLLSVAIIFWLLGPLAKRIAEGL